MCVPERMGRDAFVAPRQACGAADVLPDAALMEVVAEAFSRLRDRRQVGDLSLPSEARLATRPTTTPSRESPQTVVPLILQVARN